MKSNACAVITLIVLAVCHDSPAAETTDEALKKFGRNLEVAKACQFGQESKALLEIEQLVFTLPRDSQLRSALEQQLIAALQTATTKDAKDFLCRQLRVIGTAKSVPALEPLLVDPEVSSMALYALGYLEFPEACQAMHRALAKTTGVTQAGIINALANRRYQEAKPDLLPLLRSADRSVSSAAARALGKLGGADAIAALQGDRAAASPELAAAIDNALLQCAEDLAAAGSLDQASAIYESIRSSQPAPTLQMAALRGLVLTRQSDAAKLLVDAMRQGNAELAASAIAMIDLVKGSEATKTFVGLVQSLPPATQLLLLRALGNRRDSTASAAICEAVQSADEPVRIAALEALGKAGDAEAVTTLAAAAATDGDVKRVARASLLLLPGEAVEQRLLELVDKGSEPVRVEAIDALAGRSVSKAMGPLWKICHDKQTSVRQAAIRAIGALAAPSDLSALLQLVVQPESPDDRTLVVASVSRLLPRCQDKDKAVTAILSLLDTAPAGAQPALVQLLGATGSPQALPALRARVKDPSSDVQDSVVLALSEWPDASVLDDLLQIVASAQSAPRMEAAVKGFVRLANTSADPTEHFARVMQRVTQVSDKKVVLAGLGTQAQSPGAMELALAHLADKDLGPAAGLATVRIAYRLRGSHEKLAREALRRVVKEVNHENVRQRAVEVLNDMDKYEGHILQWVGAGPYVEKGKNGEAVYQTVFDPEKPPGATDVKWVPVNKGIGSWDIDLESMFGGLNHCAAYLRTRVWSPQETDALLEFGCDDAVKAFLNGEVVFNEWTVHGASPRQHHADIRLKKGWNDLMLKAVDLEGGWVVGCRLRARDGTALEGLKVEAP